MCWTTADQSGKSGAPCPARLEVKPTRSPIRHRPAGDCDVLSAVYPVIESPTRCPRGLAASQLGGNLKHHHLQ